MLEAGGTYYPARDQVVDADSFAKAFGSRYDQFRQMRRQMDPNALFANDQARRLGLA